MAIQVTEAWLKNQCGEPLGKLPPKRVYDIVENFGALAPWWLPCDVLEAAARHAQRLFGDLPPALSDYLRSRPKLPGSCGACWAVLVNQQPDWLPLLRAARVLPLRWQPDVAHEPRLPATLRSLADQVQATLRKVENLRGSWGLVPVPHRLLEDHDLSELPGDYGSAWAPLAAGLLLASWQGKPDTTVWASGAWADDQGILPVKGLEAKLAIAVEFGAEIFFVPGGENIEKSKAWVESQKLPEVPLDIQALAIAEARPRDALRQYRARLHMRPARDDLPKERAGYYLDRPTLRDAQQYYLEDILSEVANECCRKFDQAWPARSIAALITTVSGGTELIDLAVRVLRPRKCLALYSDLFKEAAQQVKARIGADRSGPACEVRLERFEARQFDPMMAEFRKHLDEFTCGIPPTQIVIDLTPGSKTITLALFHLAPRGSHLVYWDKDTDLPTNRAIPFSEVPLHWAAGDLGPWGQP